MRVPDLLGFGTADDKMLEIRGALEGHFIARGNNVLVELEHLLFSWPIFTLSGEGGHLILWLSLHWACLSHGPDTSGESRKIQGLGIRKTKWEDQTGITSLTSLGLPFLCCKIGMLCLYCTVIERIKWDTICKVPVTENSQQVITEVFKPQNSTSPPSSPFFPSPPSCLFLSCPFFPSQFHTLRQSCDSLTLLNYMGEPAELLP